MKAASPCSTCFRTSTRRTWIRRLAMSYSAYLGFSGPWSPPAALGTPINEDARLRVNIGAFSSLELNSGSAIITFDNGVTSILITRESETTFHALNPRCTHQGCRVDPYSIVSNAIVCPCHGSQYTMQGQVIRGPAASELLTYSTRFDGPILSIEVPGLIHRLDQIAVHSSSSAGSRIRLTFPTIAGSQYHIRHSPDLVTPFEIAPFATTAIDPANQTILDGTGATATLFTNTPGPAGFFALELIVYQIA